MSRAIPITAAVLCVLVPAGAFAAVASESFEWTGGAGARALEVSHAAGVVNVAVGGDEVVVRAEKKSESVAALAAVSITVEEKGDAVVVGVKYPEDKEVESDVTVDFNISVPESVVRAEVASASGEVVIAGVAEVAARTASGGVTVTGAYDEVRVTTASGSVAVDNSGEPTKRVFVNDVSGAVKLWLELPAEGADYEVSNVSGSLELKLTGDTANYDVALHAITGQVDSAFPLEWSGGPAGRTYAGRAGAGTNHIAINTISGSVAILAPGK
jgi:hypothetical protein